MGIIKFSGRVLPEAFSLSHHANAKISWQIDSTGMTVDFDVSIEKSKVTVTCEYAGVLATEHIAAVYVRALDLAKANVDLVSFSLGIGLIVYLDKMTDRNGITTDMLPQHIELSPLCTAYGLDHSRDQDFADVYKIVFSEPAIFMALNELTAGLSVAHAAPVNCGRAIEGIRHLVAPGLEPKKQWPVMNNALRLEKTYTDLIMENSIPQRHGERLPVDGLVVREIMCRAWIIMNRFLEYRKRGAKPLPEIEFPVLS